jgi:hypothetical protein
MIGLASIIFLNPRPLLQPNAEEREIIRKAERKMVRQIRLTLIGAALFVVVIITSLILFA